MVERNMSSLFVVLLSADSLRIIGLSATVLLLLGTGGCGSKPAPNERVNAENAKRIEEAVRSAQGVTLAGVEAILGPANVRDFSPSSPEVKNQGLAWKAWEKEARRDRVAVGFGQGGKADEMFSEFALAAGSVTFQGHRVFPHDGRWWTAEYLAIRTHK